MELADYNTWDIKRIAQHFHGINNLKFTACYALMVTLLFASVQEFQDVGINDFRLIHDQEVTGVWNDFKC